MDNEIQERNNEEIPEQNNEEMPLEEENKESSFPQEECQECKELANKPKFTFARLGCPAPEFSVNAFDKGDIHEIKLSDFKGKWVVLFFYPHDFTCVCPTEIVSFNDAREVFLKNNASIIGISNDSVYVHKEFAEKARKFGGVNPLSIPLLEDKTHIISKQYGCYIPNGPDDGASYRATYIIDNNGILRHISINDLGVGRNVDEILRLLQAFQFNDKHGDICPTNWKPGKKGINLETEDEDEIKKFFADK